MLGRTRRREVTITGNSVPGTARTSVVRERLGGLANVIIILVRCVQFLGNFLRGLSGKAASVVTPLGWSILVMVPLALFLGYSLGWHELVAVGFVGAALIVTALIYLVGRAPLQVRLAVARNRVVAGERATGAVMVSHGGRRRNWGALLEIPVGNGVAEVAVPGLRRGAEFVHEFTIPTERRGVIRIGPARTVRADPIGLIRRELAWTGVAELFIHPRTVGIPSMSTGLIRDLEGNPTRDLSSNDVSFHALREYMPGDERRNIHWKSTARTGTHMVRQFEQTRRSHLVIALSLAASDYASDDEFELAVSVTGSLGVRAIRDTRAVTVVVSESSPRFTQPQLSAVRSVSTLSRGRLLDDLASVEASESALAITGLARVTGEQTSGVSVAFLVCGSEPSSQQLRAASTQFALGVEVIAVVCDPHSAPGLRRVAGLSVLTIGYLNDLTQSLARAAAA
ncbi:MAG: DUF58 domain-containing protein [Rhodoglobus sp.]